MKIKFIDTNKSLCKKVEKLGYFEVFNEDIIKHITSDTIIVSASNPSFTFWWGIDKLIAEIYPKECEQKQARKGWNERIGKVIFTITVDNNIQASKILLIQSFNSILQLWEETETILLTGLGTWIGWLSEDDFIEVLLDIFPKKAYKWFKKWLVCDWWNGKYQFEIGKTFKQEWEVKLCNNWFHFWYKLNDIYQYYPQDSIICEVEILGKLDIWENKSCTSEIKIIKELDQYEVFKLWNRNTWNRNTWNRNTWNCNTWNRNTWNCNTWNRNTWNRNTWNCNTWNCNTWDRNTWDLNTWDRNTWNCNTWDRNTWDRNKGNYNSWYFNTLTPKVTIFNKLSKFDFWNISFPSYFYFSMTDWIYSSDMTEQEKIDNPTHLTTWWSLRKYDYKTKFIESFEKASKQEIQQTIDLPNFDYKIFEEISWISKKMIVDKLK